MFKFSLPPQTQTTTAADGIEPTINWDRCVEISPTFRYIVCSIKNIIILNLWKFWVYSFPSNAIVIVFSFKFRFDELSTLGMSTKKSRSGLWGVLVTSLAICLPPLPLPPLIIHPCTLQVTSVARHRQKLNAGH